MRTEFEVTIPLYLEATLHTKLDPFNKKARKLGFPEFTVEQVGEPFIVKQKKEHGFIAIVKKCKFLISGNVPIIEGWKVIAFVEHLPKGNIIQKFATKAELGDQFRIDDLRCEHCNKSRLRSKTWIIEKGEQRKMIGSNCVKDFLGHDPARVLRFFGFIEELRTELEDEESLIRGGGSDPRWLCVKDAIARTLHFMQTHKGFYVSRANEDRQNRKIATADLVFDSYYGNYGFEGDSRIMFEDVHGFSIDKPTEKECKLAEFVIAWVLAEENDSDYFFTLKTLLSEDWVNAKYCGYVVSSVPVYLKAMDMFEERKVQATESSWVGEVKQRLDFEALTVVSVHGYTNAFGWNNIYIMADADGNRFKWFTGSGDMEAGQKYAVRATVKKHDQYKGVKETILTRCAVQQL